MYIYIYNLYNPLKYIETSIIPCLQLTYVDNVNSKLFQLS